MIKLNSVKTLDAIPENIRSLFSIDGDSLSLDDEKIRTEQDIANVKAAKQKEVNDHNATKAELAKFKKIAATAEELQNRISDLEARSGDGNETTEKLAKVTRERNKLQNELSELREQFKSVTPEYERLKAESVQRKTVDTLSSVVKSLKGVDAERLTRALKKDVMLGIISLDESGEGLSMKDGSDIRNYAMEVAKDYGFTLKNTPGQSTPQSGSAPNSGSYKPVQYNMSAEGMFDDETESALNK